MAEREPLDLEAIKVRQRRYGQIFVRDATALIAEVERLRKREIYLDSANAELLADQARLTAVAGAARNHVETRQPHTWSALRQALNALQESDGDEQV